MYFGAHVSAAGGIDMAAERAAEIGADAVQVFTQSPRMWRPTNHKPANIERFRQLRHEHGLKAAVAHASYLINIASADGAMYRKSIDALANTVRVGEELGLDAVIFHPGSHRSAGLASCVDRLVEALREVLDHTTNTWVLMENSAGAGGTIGRTVDELAELFECVGAHPRLGICIDTCHWFVSGVDITQRAQLDAALDEVDEKIGLERLRALHINDSVTPFGSNRDRHANIGEGEIGENLSVFLGHPRLQGLPALLEVPGPLKKGADANELAKVRELHRRGVAAAQP